MMLNLITVCSLLVVCVATITTFIKHLKYYPEYSAVTYGLIVGFGWGGIWALVIIVDILGVFK